MATYPARSSGDQTTNYLRAPITFNIGTAGVVQVGTLPAGCAVLRVTIVVGTVFNFGTNNLVKVGTVASDVALVASVSVAALGAIVGTVAANAAVAPTVDTPIICTSLCTGTAGTTGQAYVIVEYAPVA